MKGEGKMLSRDFYWIAGDYDWNKIENIVCSKVVDHMSDWHQADGKKGSTVSIREKGIDFSGKTLESSGSQWKLMCNVWVEAEGIGYIEDYWNSRCVCGRKRDEMHRYSRCAICWKLVWVLRSGGYISIWLNVRTWACAGRILCFNRYL